MTYPNSNDLFRTASALIDEQEQERQRLEQHRKARKQEQKHTPGPWEAAGQKVFASGLPCSNHVATAYAVGGHGLYANARLIAAAPELLAVLQELQESAAYWSEYDVPLGIVERINGAIAKAGGAA